MPLEARWRDLALLFFTRSEVTSPLLRRFTPAKICLPMRKKQQARGRILSGIIQRCFNLRAAQRTPVSVLRPDVLSAIESVITEVEKRVKSLMKPIEGERFRRAGFVDGSYALEERRGAYLLALSAASLLVDGDRLEGVLRGSSKPLAALLIPKSYGESRASLLMSTLELLSALDLARRGVEAVFLDGSYVSGMLVPFGYVRDVYESFVAATGLDLESIDSYGEEAAGAVMEVAGGEPLASMSKLLDRLAACAGKLYGELGSRSPDQRSKKEALDFAVVYAESTAYLAALNLLLEECSSSGVAPFWVAKDAESRYIVEREGVVGWLNDLTLLDYAWRDGEAVYAVLEGSKFGRPKPCAAWPRLLHEVFGRWSAYGVAYFKLKRVGAAAQMTYPAFVRQESVERALATLLALSDGKGYPRPLSYAHHIAVLNPEFAKIVADELYKREANQLVRSVLAPSGRALAGLR